MKSTIRTILVSALVLVPAIALGQSAPTTPPNLAAVPTFNSLGDNMTGYDGMRLTWGGSSSGSGISNYVVKRVLTSSLSSTSVLELPDSAIQSITTDTSFWDSGALGHANYTYTVTAVDGEQFKSVPARLDVLTPYGKGARIKTTAESSVYSFNAKSGKMQKNGRDFQMKGAVGTELSGPVTIEANNPKNTATYYQVDFDEGADGYVESANLIGSEISGEPSTRLAIESMQALLSRLETQLKGILAKIVELRSALAAAAILSQ